jgi:hypothetical protein
MVNKNQDTYVTPVFDPEQGAGAETLLLLRP